MNESEMEKNICVYTVTFRNKTLVKSKKKKPQMLSL